ncbi:unnamed protein product [Blepharisma stoltei]|uniref:phosphatidate phosphatase n=1 Tax=Blepharisma stoltei TaxID=1481888 RepID=A0AAU9IQ00_9CILI|nr:unnamed protein product [Blepharisma stoltei]
MRFVNNLSWAFHVNGSTLSGALDVIVIEHEDGTLHCTPFHVIFGKFKVLKSRAKIVKITVNGVLTDITMKLNDKGKAYFEEKSTNENFPEEEKNYSQKRVSRNTLWAKESFHGNAHRSKSNSKAAPLDKKNNAEIQNAIEQRIELSLCGDEFLGSDSPESAFEQYKVSFKNFEKNLYDFLSNEQLILKIDGEFHSRETGIPLLYSIISSYELEDNFEHLSLETDKSPQFIKTYVLDSNRLHQLGLRYGANDVEYTVFSRLQGKRTLKCKFYLWPYTSKIIVSDIDGTITKSDFLGIVLPAIGVDWTRPGVVELYRSLSEKGYKIIYLSSRAIGQVKSTRQLLTSITQENQVLPEGPVIVSPDAVFTSLVRELIKHVPHIFKANALKQVLDLFPPDTQPFFAGFGNKLTDSIAYRQIDIPIENIFIFNDHGIVTPGSGVSIHSFDEINNYISAV